MKHSLRAAFVAVPVVGGVALGFTAYWLGWLTRDLFIEPTELGILCEENAVFPWWCYFRTGLIVATKVTPPGLVGAILAVVAWMTPRLWGRRLGLTAMVLGGLGLALYNAGPSVVALMLGVLRLIRLEDPTPQATEFESRQG